MNEVRTENLLIVPITAIANMLDQIAIDSTFTLSLSK
jgi:hypothetical protein